MPTCTKALESNGARDLRRPQSAGKVRLLQWRSVSVSRCPNESCQTKFGQAVAAWVDFSLAAFPISFVKDLKLSTKAKVALCSLLSFGVL